MIFDKKVYSILAKDLNNGIGFQNEILFKNKIDMYIFKYISSSIKDCVVGKVTYEGLPTIIKKTRNLHVLTRSSIKDDLLINVLPSIENIKDINNESVVVIGGAKVYELFAPYVDVWFVTTFKKEALQVDTYLSHNVISSYENKTKTIIYEDDEMSFEVYC